MDKNYSIKYVGLDVHKKTICVAVADGDINSEPRIYGTISSDLNSLDKAIRQLQSSGAKLRIVYEAGPCGYGLYRYLTSKGHDCIVVPPSRIPKKPSDRIKTDRRDALSLARLHRANELTGIYVPDPEDEAIRDISRARESVQDDLKRSKQQLSSFLLKNGLHFTGKTNWSKAHFSWLAKIKFEHPGQQLVLQELINTVNYRSERLKTLEQQLEHFVKTWRMGPIVEQIQALRGVSFYVAVTTISELGDLTRFKNPRELMMFLGLVPSEHSSGEKKKKGPITKAGNIRARKALIAGAWAYRFQARITQELAQRLKHLNAQIIQISWKAQVRLCTRYRTLKSKKKKDQVAVVAIARELVGFIWAINKIYNESNEAALAQKA
jgi:transposase